MYDTSDSDFYQVRLSYCLGPDLVAAAINQGYRLIDTAELYNNEEDVGSGIKQSKKNREDIFVVSKWWPSPQGAKSALKALDHCLNGFVSQILTIDFYFSFFIVVFKRIMLICIFFMHHKVVIVLKHIVHYSMPRNKAKLG